MNLKIAKIAAVLAVSAATITGPAFAEFPERPIEVVVPWPPGDVEDIIARLISDQLQADYGVPSAVVNMKGGGGIIGASHVAEAAADGYTIGMFTGNILTAHIIKERAPFGRDTFVPLGIAVNYPMGLWTRSDMPFDDVAGLAEYAKSNDVSLGHFGFKGPPTRQTMLAAKKLGFEFSGSAAFDETNCTTLTNGDADVVISTVKLLKVCLDSGDAKGLAAFTATRISILPDLPTLDEQVPGIAAPAWAGIFVRADTPQDARDKISAAAAKVMASDEVAAIAARTGAVLGWVDGDAAVEFVDTQYLRVEQLFAQ